jgi:addiction module HigA family antidote
MRKLWMIDAGPDLNSLRVPPGNRLEALSGNRLGQHSIRINDRWRIFFVGAMATPMTWRSSTIIRSSKMSKRKISPIHPGEVLMEEFLKPMGISQYRLAKDISVPPRRINEIVHGDRCITADTALRLGRYFGVSPQFWLNLQSHFDLAQEEDRIGDRLSSEVHALSIA